MIWYGLNLRLKQLRTNLILVRLVPHFFDTSPGGSIRDLKTSQAAEFRKNTVRQVEDDMGRPGMTWDDMGPGMAEAFPRGCHRVHGPGLLETPSSPLLGNHEGRMSRRK